MGFFLDSRLPYEAYREMAEDRYFVDKSLIIRELMDFIGKKNRYLCIMRPRRFGKTVMASMIGAFFGRAADSSSLFGQLEIARVLKDTDAYHKHLNTHHVIYLDFSVFPRNCTSYGQYIDRFQNGINRDLAEAYPEFAIRTDGTTWDILTDIFEKTGDRFLFIIDEWDAVFHMPFITEKDRESFLLFLKLLLKDKMYAELVYMTGILPIAKYSDGSELNMFTEYHMALSERFSGYFGFSEKETDSLYAIYRENTPNARITRNDLAAWYDGYYTAAGSRIYNPRSVICALTDNQLRNYWTSSGTYDSVFAYIRHNIDGIQDDLAFLFAGEAVPAAIQEYAASAMQLATRDEIYSAMVIYGLLTFQNGCVSIPNKELMESYAAMMKKEKSLGYIYRLANISRKMLSATLEGDTKTMSEILNDAHNTESPIFSYNNEIELSAIVNLVYLAARDTYRVEREDKAGRGYADFIFYPEQKNADSLILELKAGGTPEQALQQIKDKNYALRLKGKLGENQNVTGRILGVGISYDKKSKEHSCIVEEL